MAGGPPSHSAIKGEVGSCVSKSVERNHQKPPPIALTLSDRKGALVPTGSSTGVAFRRRAVLSKAAVILCTTSGREWIWSTSTSLSHSCIRSREELVMYSCIYVKNLFSMLDLVHRARSCVNSRTQNLTMESEPFSCIDPVGERSREER